MKESNLVFVWVWGGSMEGVWEGQAKGIIKGHEEISGSDGYVHQLDCSDVFINQSYHTVHSTMFNLL